MMNLQPGDLIFVRGTGWIGKAIERITNSPYSHVAVYVGAGNVIEAQGGRTVGFQRLSFYEGCYDAYRTIKPLTEAEGTAIVNYLVSQIGGKYDYFDIFILFLRYKLKIRIPYVEAKHHFICETLAADAYESAGITLDGNDSPGGLSESPLLYKLE